ncbi:hypothetical protein F0562_002603 [Nyssa sinensis]|uniref:Uncharacterized protein n=1 Tax=Nyssa sinensis TaxID=561372 RepID=A0A5J5C6W3_9ASTE|nr:hypothetical protein F0562_002603 [Nyssa sinensis]
MTVGDRGWSSATAEAEAEWNFLYPRMLAPSSAPLVLRLPLRFPLPADDRKDQVIWAGFDELDLGPDSFKHVLLIGYQNGFQVIDVEDASNFRELVSKRDGPVTFLQMLPTPAKSDGDEGFRSSHPLLLIVAGR